MAEWQTAGKYVAKKGGYGGSPYKASSYSAQAVSPEDTRVTVPMSVLPAEFPRIYVPYVHSSVTEETLREVFGRFWGPVVALEVFTRPGKHLDEAGRPESVRKAVVELSEWFGHWAAQDARAHLLNGEFVKLTIEPGKPGFIGCMLYRPARNSYVAQAKEGAGLARPRLAPDAAAPR